MIERVKRITEDLACGIPSGIVVDTGDLVKDSCSGRTWMWTGTRYIQVSHQVSTVFELPEAPTLSERIAAVESLPDGVQLYTGDSTEIPVELQGSSQLLIIRHNLGVVPSLVSASIAQGAVSELFLPEQGAVYSTADGMWTAWKAFGCVVGSIGTVTVSIGATV